MTAESFDRRQEDIPVLMFVVPPVVLNLLHEIAMNKNTTVGSLVTSALRDVVVKEVGEDRVMEMEKSI